MATSAQLAQYCVDHHYILSQGTHMNTMFAGTLLGDVIIAVAGFVVGHLGWAGMKALYTTARSDISALTAPKTVTVPTTITTVTTGTATVTS